MKIRAVTGCFALSVATALSSQPTNSAAAPSTRVDVQVHFEGKDRRPVNFEFVKGLITFQATIQGKPGWVVLDNAMDTSLVDGAFARDQGLEAAEALPPLQTTGGSLARQRVNNVSVEIPHQLKMVSPFSATDLSFATRTLGRPITMILGKPYTNNIGFLVYSSRKQFQLGPSGKLNLPAATRFATLSDDPRRQVEVNVNGQKLLATIDLGSSGGLTLSETAWKRLGLDKVKHTRSERAALDGNPATVLHAKVDRVTIGPFEARQVDAALGPVLPVDRDGMVGMGFLSRFDFFLDEKQRKLWLISN